MDAKKINALLVSIDRGSLTAAAAELGYTQSGLTHMMNALEDELGLNLLVRSKNGVHLSPAGQELLPQMRALAAAASALEERAERLRQEKFFYLAPGSLHQRRPPVAACGAGGIPAHLPGHRSRHGRRRDHGDIRQHQKRQDGLRHCELPGVPLPGSQLGSLRDDALVAVLPGNYPLESPAFPVKDFTDKEFLMPSACFDLDINPVFSMGGEKVSPRVRYTNLDDAAIVSMVEHGLGVSILSELVMQDMNNSVRVAPLSPPAWRALGIIMSERRQNDQEHKALRKMRPHGDKPHVPRRTGKREKEHVK